MQLPTFSYFSVNTTVTVPDRGSAYLGGVNRAAEGRNEFGTPLLPFRPFRNVGIGRETSASGMWVTATIHDFDAMDRYLLSAPVQSTVSRLPTVRTEILVGWRSRAAGSCRFRKLLMVLVNLS